MPPLRLIVLGALLGQSGATARAQDPPSLWRIADLCIVPQGGIDELPPFRIRGVVTSVQGGHGNDGQRSRAVFTIHDGSAGIFVVVGSERSEVEWHGDPGVLDEICAGAEIELEGVLERGAFKPNILATDITLVGHAVLPAPKQVPMQRLLSGAEVTERVEAGGVVQSCLAFKQGTWLLRIDTHAGYFMARIRRSCIDARSLVDAEVRVRGVVASAYNGRSEFLRPSIWVEREEDITVVTPAPKDPFAVSTVPLGSLDGFSATGRSLHRRRTEGTVTYCREGEFVYLQEGTRGIKIGMASAESLLPGDRIEAAGFLDISNQVAGLRGALVRKLDNHQPIEPIPTSLAAIRRSYVPVTRGMPSSPHDFDGLLVEVTGRLLSAPQFTARGNARLLLGDEDEVITADLDAAEVGSLGELRPGSLLKVTGVAVVEYAALREVQELSQPVGLNLLARDAGDIAVIDAASWWTPGRLGTAATLLGLTLAAVIGWSLTLHRLLRNRTSRLEEVMQVHRDQELEFRGALHERQRLGADMHDGVQQLIAGAAFRLEAAAPHLEDGPPIVHQQFAAARSALLRAQKGLRDCLTGLLHFDVGPTEFPALLEYAAAAMDHWPEDLVRVRLEGGLSYPLSRHLQGNLLLLMQEAVANALKHGDARRVEITLRYGEDEFEMILQDDGRGFDPQQAADQQGGPFGLESMRHRMKWLGGAVEILSSPGRGTRICARVPRSQVRPANARGTAIAGRTEGQA